MIYFDLFFMFFKIGLFTFGGGYAMIPLIKQNVVEGGYLNLDQLIDFIAISESTPGPFAVNIATFVGYQSSGVLGAVAATLGVVLPSFIIILVIASIGSKFLNNPQVKMMFLGLRPAVVGLILAAALLISKNVLFPQLSLSDPITGLFSINAVAVIIFASIFIFSRKFKSISPIYLILLSAVLGLILY